MKFKIENKLYFDMNERFLSLQINGQEDTINLTAMESKVLALIMLNKGNFIRLSELSNRYYEQEAYDYEIEHESQCVMNCIHRLKKKSRLLSLHIAHVHKKGYAFIFEGIENMVIEHAPTLSSAKYTYVVNKATIRTFISNLTRCVKESESNIIVECTVEGDLYER